MWGQDALTIRLPATAQGQPLLHAKAMLLIDNDQTEPREADLFLEQRVRAHRNMRLAPLAGGLRGFQFSRGETAR